MESRKYRTGKIQHGEEIIEVFSPGRKEVNELFSKRTDAVKTYNNTEPLKLKLKSKGKYMIILKNRKELLLLLLLLSIVVIIFLIVLLYYAFVKLINII